MALWIAAALAAFFIKGLCGFANTLVFTGVAGFSADNVLISPVELVLGYPSNLILTWKNRKALSFRVWGPLAALVILGSIPGALLLKNADARVLKIVFGAVVVLIGAEMLLREYRPGKGLRGSRVLLWIIGILSGLLCGLFGVGALMAAYVGRVTDTTDGFKANLSAVFIVENTVRLILYACIGILTAAALKKALILAPFMLLGLFAGMKCAKVVDEKWVRRLVIFFLILSGIVLIVKNI